MFISVGRTCIFICNTLSQLYQIHTFDIALNKTALDTELTREKICRLI